MNSLFTEYYNTKNINCLDVITNSDYNNYKTDLRNFTPQGLLFLKCAIEHYKFYNKDTLDINSIKYYYVYNLIIEILFDLDLTKIVLDTDYLIFLNNLQKDFLIIDLLFTLDGYTYNESTLFFTKNGNILIIDAIINMDHLDFPIIQILYCNYHFNNKFNMYVFDSNIKIYLKNLLKTNSTNIRINRLPNIYKLENKLIISSESRNLSLELVKVVGDGACMYHSILTSIYMFNINLPNIIKKLFAKYPKYYEPPPLVTAINGIGRENTYKEYYSRFDDIKDDGDISCIGDKLYKNNIEIKDNVNTFDKIIHKIPSDEFIRSDRYKLIIALKNLIHKVNKTDNVLDIYTYGNDGDLRILSNILNLRILSITTMSTKTEGVYSISIICFGEKYINTIILYNTSDVHFDAVYDYKFV